MRRQLSRQKRGWEKHLEVNICSKSHEFGNQRFIRQLKRKEQHLKSGNKLGTMREIAFRNQGERGQLQRVE